VDPGTKKPYTTGSVPHVEITKKLAETLVCGHKEGWASLQANSKTGLVNPCGNGRCVLTADMTDYTCECFTGFAFEMSPERRTCIKSKSLVTCKPGSRRVAADRLIVGQFPKFAWIGGIYERRAGLGYQNTDEEIYNPKTMLGQTTIQRYMHDVPLKGREFYEKYEVDQKTCNVKLDTDGEKIVSATLFYNYDENQWEFNEIDAFSKGVKPTSLKVYAKDTRKCVEDVTSWTYIYETSGIQSVGMNFIPKAPKETKVLAPTNFQIRDLDDTDIEITGLAAIVNSVYPSPSTYKCPSFTDNYLTNMLFEATRKAAGI